MCIISFTIYSQEQTAGYWDKKGIVAENQKKYKEAVDDYSQAIALNPKYADAYFGRAIAAEKLEWYADALKDFEAPNLYSDLKHLKEKVDAGAQYIVTQMYYDNKKYFEYVKLCRDNGINVPIIPGLKMITQKKQLSILPKVFHIDVPIELYKEIDACKDDGAVKEVGIKWAIQQSNELIKNNVPCIHFYTMGASETTRRVASEVF